METDVGTYLIVFHSENSRRVRVGKLGVIDVNVGYYLYVGSAFGPGGIKARVSRHHKKRKTKHWHLDYLSTVLTPIEVWFTYDSQRREHDWADLLLVRSDIKPVKGFGCSDCRCAAHFFFRRARPKLADFRKAITKNLTLHAPVLLGLPSDFRAD